MTRQVLPGGRASRSRQWRFHDSRGGSALLVHVRPGSPKTRIHAIQQESVVEIHLVGDDNPWHTNQELVRFLSQVLGVPEAHIEIVAGLYGRGKVITVEGLSAEEASRRLRNALENDCSPEVVSQNGR